MANTHKQMKTRLEHKLIKGFAQLENIVDGESYKRKLRSLNSDIQNYRNLLGQNDYNKYVKQCNDAWSKIYGYNRRDR